MSSREAAIEAAHDDFERRLRRLSGAKSPLKSAATLTQMSALAAKQGKKKNGGTL